jgi:hypothetical protein
MAQARPYPSRPRQISSGQVVGRHWRVPRRLHASAHHGAFVDVNLGQAIQIGVGQARSGQTMACVVAPGLARQGLGNDVCMGRSALTDRRRKGQLLAGSRLRRGGKTVALGCTARHVNPRRWPPSALPEEGHASRHPTRHEICVKLHGWPSGAPSVPMIPKNN